ncbi:hypothetical protein AVEN_263653-1 [Araneus ventricosus]|uniref:Uncharacterized protein n=1 Tax=Araneus ventricosus TaxID=182803 RepID=A0A4Y2ATI6_ARAVE|nr:hypothetical protein AVEN_263653-1 [Araneus ventricosus]
MTLVIEKKRNRQSNVYDDNVRPHIRASPLSLTEVRVPRRPSPNRCFTPSCFFWLERLKRPHQDGICFTCDEDAQIAIRKCFETPSTEGFSFNRLGAAPRSNG